MKINTQITQKGFGRISKKLQIEYAVNAHGKPSDGVKKVTESEIDFLSSAFFSLEARYLAVGMNTANEKTKSEPKMAYNE